MLTRVRFRCPVYPALCYPLSYLVLSWFVLVLNVAPSNGGDSGIARTGHTKSSAIVAKQWDVLDIRFEVDEVPSHPTGLRFASEFIHDRGRRLEVSGFYDDDGSYVVRFTPPLPGVWQYTTESGHRSLNALRGKIQVEKAASGRRGGIEIDRQNPRRFRYANGKSYYPIAFECDWLFALDGNNPDDIPVTRKFIDKLAENGFNQIVMNVYAHDVNWKKDEALKPEHEFGDPDIFPFRGDNERPKHAELNIEFFQRLDRVIHYLDTKGIAAHLMIYVWNKQVNWPEADSDADNQYFDYVVRRYQAFPNLIWDISKEALGYGHTDVHYITNRIERLRAADVYQRLITVHDYGYCRKFPEQVDFVSVQLWSSELYSVMRRVCEAIPGKPILNIEHGGYERGPYVVFNGNYTSPEVCLERAWQCVFAGTFPTHYWQGAAWNVIVPDWSDLASEAQPQLQYYRHMREFAERFEIDQLTPGDKKSNAGFCLHNGDNLYVYYVPKECDFIGLRLPKELAGGTMRGIWFNPFDGSYSAPKVKEIVRWPSFQVPPGEGFRLLVLTTEAAELDTSSESGVKR